MELNFETFCKHYRNLKVNQKEVGYLLEDILPTIKEFPFVESHEVFYPEGIFTDVKLNLFFFTKSHINKITILEKSVEIQTWKYEEVSSVKLSILDNLGVKLDIIFKYGEQINFDSHNDTNKTWSNRFKGKIKCIHEILTRA